MPKITTKAELIAEMASGYATLQAQLDSMTECAINSEFDETDNPKKCGARWIYDRCTRDLLIHIYEWQNLMCDFVANIRAGQQRDYLPDEYRRDYHAMDKMLVEKHQATSFADACTMLAQSHEKMLQLADGFTQEELFTKGYYKCTYTTDMAAYFASVTSSPYQQATKILKKHSKSIDKRK
ncbi:MAG: ClbS/DfsB family four-helix bundle protein [Muribaculaceae bacterium]|nr:ClbS/DfsB family four-helix bundle protein [Muribaculaceae bacterium]